VFNVLFVGYSLAKNNLNNTYQCNMISKKISKTMNYLIMYSAFFLTVAIGNCMVKLVPPVNFCSDQNIQTIFGTKLEDFLNYRIDYNSIS
jgi:hypothetical protein